MIPLSDEQMIIDSFDMIMKIIESEDIFDPAFVEYTDKGFYKMQLCEDDEIGG